jgi:hypothetical protein
MLKNIQQRILVYLIHIQYVFLIVFLDTALNKGCSVVQNFLKPTWSTIDNGYSCKHIIKASSFLAIS